MLISSSGNTTMLFLISLDFIIYCLYSGEPKSLSTFGKNDPLFSSLTATEKFRFLTTLGLKSGSFP